MNIMNLFRKKPETRMYESGWQGPITGQLLYGDSPVNQAAAESLSTVIGCTNVVSSAVSVLPALVFQRQGKTRVEVTTGEIPDLIRNGPNPHQTWPEFIEMLVAETLLRGNGLVEVGNGFMRVVPWNWVQAQMVPGDKLVYDVYPQTSIYAPFQGKRRRLLQNEVIHIRDRSDDGLIGKSRLKRAAAVIRNAQTVHDFAGAAFRNGFFPSGVITSENQLNREQRQLLNDVFVKAFSGAHNAARALVLDQNIKWSGLTSISPEDAELLASRKFTTEEICRIFQTPPPLVQDYSHNTFTNSQEASRWFAQFCLLPWVRKIEAAFNRGLFEGTDMELVLDMSSFDRGDPTARWQNHAIAAGNGILDVDEIREIEGWGPRAVTSGDNRGDI